MSNINPAFSIVQPTAEGVGWAIARTIQGGVYGTILRDDAMTQISCYMDRSGYTRQKLINTMLASSGLTANETARINAMAAATNW